MTTTKTERVARGTYWATFSNGRTGCVQVTEDATRDGVRATIAAQPGWEWAADPAIRIDLRTLPYPAAPRINPVDEPGCGVCPSFCYAPETCAGRTSCPKSYSCVD